MKRCKKTLLLSAVAVLAATTAVGQGFYAGGHVGEATPLMRYPERNPLGTGSVFALTGGYMFNQNVGIELGLMSLRGRPGVLAVPQYIDSNHTAKKYATNLQHNSYRAVPQLLVTSSTPGPFDFYGRFGLSVGLYHQGHGRVRINSSNQLGEAVSFLYRDYTGGMSLGATAAAGVSGTYNGRHHFFAEAAFLALGFSPKRYSTTGWSGQNALENKTTREKEGGYVRNPSETVDPDKPWEGTRWTAYGMSLGVNIGMRIYLFTPVKREAIRDGEFADSIESAEWYVSGQLGGYSPVGIRQKTTPRGLQVLWSCRLNISVFLQKARFWPPTIRPP